MRQPRYVVDTIVRKFLNVSVVLGAGSDFESATRIATAMVKKFGMSEKVRTIIVLCEVRVSKYGE